MPDDRQQPAAAPARPPLAADESGRLIEFARACKAAARAVTLYPDGHPAIAATLGRIKQLTTPPALSAPMTLTVLPDTLLLENRGLARPESAVTELAVLLHNHLIGELTINPEGDVDSWRNFLRLLGRSNESLRAEGGIARAWTTMGGQHVQVREIDYGEVLRERPEGDTASWDRVIANCLQGTIADVEEAQLREIVALFQDADRLGEFVTTLEAKGGHTIGAKTDAILGLLRTVMNRLSKGDAGQSEAALDNAATAIGRLSPDMLMGLLARGTGEDEDAAMVESVVHRMSGSTIAKFVARNVIAGDTPTDRLAQVFQTLVRDGEERPRLLDLARTEVAASPLGSTEGFEDVWDQIAEKLLASYSDQKYVSEDYSRELTTSKTQALEVEQASDDPPERVSAWLRTVATTALRGLDLTLILDLLRIEQDEDRWGALMTSATSLLEDLLLVGDFDASQKLVAVIAHEAKAGESTKRRQHAMIAIDLLVEGPMLRHIVTHLGTIDDAQFERVKAMCVSLGVVLVRPLAETLAVEERTRTRERVTSLLLAYGPEARKTIERLKASTNAAVRRTAVLLMREFGGSEALPELTELLDDSEPQVQRDAVRAILNVGTNDAYEVLQKALTNGTSRSREAILMSISSLRDERATPLFIFILRNVDHRGQLSAVYLRAIESLGALKDADAVTPLKEALYKGEWWAPGRTKALRAAAAAALARIGTGEAVAALEEAATSGSRGVRTAARPHLAEAKRRGVRHGGAA